MLGAKKDARFTIWELNILTYCLVDPKSILQYKFINVEYQNLKLASDINKFVV